MKPGPAKELDADGRRFHIGSGPIALLVIGLVVAGYLSFSQALFNDGDTSWHLAAGKLILQTGSVPETDPFSFTFYGSAWTAHEWLAEVAMAGAFRLGSWGGLALLFSLAVSALLLLLGVEISRWHPIGRTIAALAAIFIILGPSILARPHVLAWPLLAAWVLILMRARDAERAPALGWALLMLLWANLHGSFVMGLLLIGAFGLEALLEKKDRRTFVNWSIFGAASLLLSLLTPHGWHGLLFPLEVSSMQSLPMISEWRRTTFAEDWFFLATVLAVGILLLYRRPKLSLVRLILLLGLTYLALAHARHQAVLAIVASLVLAEPLSGKSRGEVAQGAAPSGTLAAFLIASVVGVILLAGLRLAVPVERRDSATYPVSAIASVPGDLRTRPVFNAYSFGGPLILHGVRPFIDGRADLYGDSFMFDYQAIMDGDGAALRRASERWGIRWTILSPSDNLVRVLDRDEGWRRIYADEWAVVHVAR